MRNLLCFSVLLLSAAWVAAQGYPSQSPSSSSNPSSSGSQTTPSSGQSGTASTDASTSMSGNQSKVEGCLNSSGGSYTLRPVAAQLTSSVATLHSWPNT